MADSTRIFRIVDFSRSRQFPDPDRNDHCCLNTAIRKLLSAMLNCYQCRPYAVNFRLNDCRQCSLAFIEDWPPRGGGSRREPRPPFSFDRSASKRQHLTIDQAGGRISISSHAKGSYPIPKISIGFHTLSLTFPASFPYTFPGHSSY